MTQTCAEMGEEQDKFALAVIIFKLLNDGIHPFSGSPSKTNDNMLSIQERIAGYHYAYGLWPDTYQRPHPYSIHDYFDKETMNLFERAFTKGKERPSALEWQAHLDYLLNHFKRCKKDKNHVYFTPKGCGLCMVAEKFRIQMENLKKQQKEPETVRGMEIKKLATENLRRKKLEKEHLDKFKYYVLNLLVVIFLLFFTFLYKIASFFKDGLQNAGVFAQLTLIFLGVLGVNKLLSMVSPLVSDKLHRSLLSMIQIYAYISFLIAFLVVNGLPFDWFKLSDLSQ